MESTLSILVNYVKEFVPANKGHFMAKGVALILMGICLWITAHTSGLHGELTYLILHPGVTAPTILLGIAFIVAAVVMKLPKD